MKEVLGVQPTPIDDTFQDMVYAMVDLGIVRKAKKYKQVTMNTFWLSQSTCH